MLINDILLFNYENRYRIYIAQLFFGQLNVKKAT